MVTVPLTYFSARLNQKALSCRSVQSRCFFPSSKAWCIDLLILLPASPSLQGFLAKITPQLILVSYVKEMNCLYITRGLSVSTYDQTAQCSIRRMSSCREDKLHFLKSTSTRAQLSRLCINSDRHAIAAQVFCRNRVINIFPYHSTCPWRGRSLILNNVDFFGEKTFNVKISQ